MLFRHNLNLSNIYNMTSESCSEADNIGQIKVFFECDNVKDKALLSNGTLNFSVKTCKINSFILGPHTTCRIIFVDGTEVYYNNRTEYCQKYDNISKNVFFITSYVNHIDNICRGQIEFFDGSCGKNNNLNNNLNIFLIILVFGIIILFIYLSQK